MRTKGSFFPSLTLATIDSLDRYHDTVESQLQSAKEEEYTRILGEIRNLRLDWGDEITEWGLAMQEHTATHDMLFANFFRYSFIVLLFLVLENRLKELCGIVAHLKQESPPIARREVVKTYKNFLKSLGVSVSKEFWTSIHDLNKVRNCIVHASGNVKGSKDEQHLRNIAQSEPGLRVSRGYQGETYPLYLEDDMLIVEPEYCRRIVANIRWLFEELFQAVPLRGIVIE